MEKILQKPRRFRTQLCSRISRISLKDDKHANPLKYHSNSRWESDTLADVTSFTDHVAHFSICLSSRENISRILLQLAPIWTFETTRERPNRLKFTLLLVLICKFVCRNQRLAEPGMLNKTGRA